MTPKKISLFAIVLAGLYAIYSFLLMPIYNNVCADVIYSEGYLPYILETVNGLFDLVIFSWIFGFCLFALEKYGAGRAVIGLLCAALVDMVRYYTLLVSENGEFFEVLATFALDVLQPAVVIGLWALLRKKKSFTQLAPLVSALVIAAFKIGMRVRFDIFYGAPEDIAEAMLMLAYYLSDLMCGVVVLLLTKLFSALFAKRNSR